MASIKNYGLSVLISKEKALYQKGKKRAKTYSKKEHEELKTAIYLLKQQFMVNKMFIDVECTEEELKNIVESQYITMQGKTWSIPHHEVVTLQINKGKGRLTITEVEFKDEPLTSVK